MEENSILVKVNQSLDQLDKKNVKSCLNFLNKYEKVLHPNHHLLIAVKLNLIDLLAWQDKLPVVDDQNLNWIIKTCREIYVLIESLIPAEHRLLGIILYQLQLALMEDGRRKVTCDSNQIRLNLVVILTFLKFT